MSGPDRIDPSAIQWEGSMGLPGSKAAKAEVEVPNTVSGTRKNEAETTRTQVLTPLEAREKTANTVSVERKNALPNLTPGQLKADEAFAKDYTDWRSGGGFATVDQTLNSLRDAMLALRTSDTISGPVVGRMPDFVRQAVGRGIPVQQEIEKGLTATLRQVLGAQFTENEGVRLLQRSYDPRLSEEENRKKVLSEIESLRQKAAAKEASARYFEQHGTLAGYRQSMADDILKEYPSAIAEGPAPEENRQRVGLLEQPPEGGQISGTPIQGWRLSPEATAEINAYVNNSPDFTPEGFAKLVTEKAVAEGRVRPEQSADYEQRQREAAQGFFGKMTPEQRKVVPGGLDYSQIDKAAQENAGLGEVALTAASNLLPSAAQLVQGLTALPADAIVSVLTGERRGSIKSTTDLAMELLSMAGGAPEGETVRAVGEMLDRRYGGWQNIKNSIATDPLGMAGDLSTILSAGGSALGRLPGTLGSVGEGIATAGRVIDPLSGMAAIAEAAPQLRNSRAGQAVANVPGAVAGNLLGLTTGVRGGQGFRTAFDVGVERGRTGAPTARTTNFLENMRGRDPGEIIPLAEQAVAQMQQRASQAYRDGMLDVSRDATTLDFAPIDARLAGLRDRAYYRGQVRDPRAADAYNRIHAIVEEWKGLDPAQFHTPEGMDALKQRIGDVADTYNTGNDRRAASIANGVYREVREAIAQQVPTYARTMRDYEKASGLLREIRRTFSLTPNATVDTQLRKLQSVLRNDAQSSYGYRTQLAGLMDRQQHGQLMDSLAGQSVSGWTPRGMAAVPAGIEALTGVTGLATGLIPGAAAVGHAGAIPALALSSPRLMGEASYGLGRAAGTAMRGVDAVTQSPALQRLYELYSDNPEMALALAQVGSRAQETDKQALFDKYGSRAPVDDPYNLLGGQ